MLIQETTPFSTPRIAKAVIADMNGLGNQQLFTVTGDIACRVWGVVGATAVTSTSGTTTLSVGTLESTAELLSASTVNNSQFAATDVWGDTSPTKDVEAIGGGNWRLIGGPADVFISRSVDDITAGSITIYMWWFPASEDGNVVAV